MKTAIIDFSECSYSNRHGIYGGLAGDKDGIVYNRENWMVKYPRLIKEKLNGVEHNIYTAAPLSEYIGSHIFDMIGIPVHETMLGIRNHKLVVACKDFSERRGDLTELRTIKNAANKELSEELNVDLGTSMTGDAVLLNELLIHFDKNPILTKVEGVQERFWDTAIIDVLIDNNDRNNGNAGLLFDEKTNTYKLAPVYDNGNAFCNKTSDERITGYFAEDTKTTYNRIIGSRTAYEMDGHTLAAKKLLLLDNPVLQQELIRMAPIMEGKMKEIAEFIQNIPAVYIPQQETFIPVMSDIRKDYYIRSLEIRFRDLIRPAYEKALESYKNHSNIQTCNDSIETER